MSFGSVFSDGFAPCFELRCTLIAPTSKEQRTPPRQPDQRESRHFSKDAVSLLDTIHLECFVPCQSSRVLYCGQSQRVIQSEMRHTRTSELAG